MCFCNKKNQFFVGPEKEQIGPNKHVKHDLGVFLSLLRQTAGVGLRMSADVSYVYFAVVDVT